MELLPAGSTVLDLVRRAGHTLAALEETDPVQPGTVHASARERARGLSAIESLLVSRGALPGNVAAVRPDAGPRLEPVGRALERLADIARVPRQRRTRSSPASTRTVPTSTSRPCASVAC